MTAKPSREEKLEGLLRAARTKLQLMLGGGKQDKVHTMDLLAGTEAALQPESAPAPARERRPCDPMCVPAYHHVMCPNHPRTAWECQNREGCGHKGASRIVPTTCEQCGCDVEPASPAPPEPPPAQPNVHHEFCDVRERSPNYGPGVKPCNCGAAQPKEKTR